MSYCSACGSKIEGSERFCANCGEEQQPKDRLTPRRQSPARRAKGLPLILIPLVLIAVVAGAIILRPAPVISVPGDYPTIQAAIDAAEDGDVIVVEPGTYRENIDFMGKAITLRSTAPDDPEVVAATIINGGNNGSVVTFRTGETAESVLSGFTITGGSGTLVMRKGIGGYLGGGILVMMASPTIKNNTITGNTAQDGGGGIAVLDDSSPTIKNNTITGNTAWGAGDEIAVIGNSFPTLTGNTITGNLAGWRDGLTWRGGPTWVSGCSTLHLKTPDE
ncbi:right-handed parallel beta-helix repeat-containing protein [candidate division NPL-UPA2 bacterium]|nr:right-handed parallel beta-helix repeat-containing protein [candidate division NPL-UPA2 bacterium]